MSGGTLFVVATPIGNLGDLGPRALEVLAAVPLVAAEDTRVLRRLLARTGIAPRAISYHARNAAGRGPALLDHLRSGSDLALVTDAGTPGISDPGDGLVAAWGAEGGRVVPVAGPSAVTAALSATGIAGPRWSFEGFLPRSGRERRARIARLAGDERGSVVFESPGRLSGTLRALADACGPDRPAAVCRELTKLHEEILRGSLGTLGELAAAGGIDPRGEAVIVIGRHEAAAAAAAGTEARSAADGTPLGAAGGGADTARHDAFRAAGAEVDRLVAAGLARAEAARQVARATGLPRRALYGAADRPGPQ